LLLCSSYLPLGVPNGLLLTSHHQPVQSIITVPGVVMMSSASLPQRTSIARLPYAFPGGDMEILAGSAHHVPGCLVLQDRSRAFSGMPLSPSWGEKPSLASFPPCKGERPSSYPSQQRGKVSPDARQCLAKGRACGGFHRGHHSWIPSRKWLRVKGFRHGRASKDAGRGVLTTSLRSSVEEQPLPSLCLWCPLP
jgi:hypothetical protein